MSILKRVRKTTSIGKSKRTRFRNKKAKLSKKIYKGQGSKRRK